MLPLSSSPFPYPLFLSLLPFVWKAHQYLPFFSPFLSPYRAITTVQPWLHEFPWHFHAIHHHELICSTPSLFRSKVLFVNTFGMVVLPWSSFFYEIYLIWSLNFVMRFFDVSIWSLRVLIYCWSWTMVSRSSSLSNSSLSRLMIFKLLSVSASAVCILLLWGRDLTATDCYIAFLYMSVYSYSTFSVSCILKFFNFSRRFSFSI